MHIDIYTNIVSELKKKVICKLTSSVAQLHKVNVWKYVT